MAKTKKIEKLGGEVSYTKFSNGVEELWGMGNEESLLKVLNKINEIINTVNELSERDHS